jgi:RNA polymerase sigma-70 factor (ECF subfamily)
MMGQHLPAVLAIARRIVGNDADAQDVAQEVFLSLHSALSRGSVRTNPGAWARSAAVTAAISHSRRESSRQHTPIDQKTAESLFAKEETPLEDLELHARILPIMENLPAQQRHVFVLRVFEELPYETIGRLLGMRAETARKHWQQACERLRVRTGCNP